MKTAFSLFVIFSLLFVPLFASQNETLPVWKVEQGDRFQYRIRFGMCPRPLDYDQRWFDVDEMIYMEILDLGNLTEDSIWAPYSMILCHVTYYLHNGTSLPNVGWTTVRQIILPKLGPIPVGNWSEASMFLIERNKVLTYNLSYEVIEDATSWGFTLHNPNWNMTDTRIWSKDDGSLTKVVIRNGTYETMTPYVALDLYLDRISPTDMSGVITLSVITGGAVVIAFFIVKKRKA